MIEILIADDHPVVRAGVRALLSGEPDFVVVGEAATPESAVALAADLSPSVVLMDLQFGLVASGSELMGGADATRRIRATRCARAHQLRHRRRYSRRDRGRGEWVPVERQPAGRTYCGNSKCSSGGECACASHRRPPARQGAGAAAESQCARARGIAARCRWRPKQRDRVDTAHL